MLDEVCSGTKFHPTFFDVKVRIFHVGLVWWGVSSNIHKVSQISNVFTFEMQFENSNLLMRFYFEFVSITNIYCGKAEIDSRGLQDHVLQQRRRYARYDDRESLRKPC